MSVGRPFELPEELRPEHDKVRRLSWLSIALLVVAASLLFLTLGQSQAMKTAWVSDVLTAIPPIGTIELFGHQLWLGWAMVGSLFFSMCVGILLGKLKGPIAEKLHSKAVQAEAEMNQAEWMSEGAAILGILLVAFGFWWGDSAAAAFISVEIIRDGWHNVRQVIGDLMDESPTKLGKRELEELPEKLRDAARALPWVADAGARLREHGHAVTGEVFVVPREGSGMDSAQLLRAAESATTELQRLDWRLHGIVVVPVGTLESSIPPRVGETGRAAR